MHLLKDKLGDMIAVSTIAVILIVAGCGNTEPDNTTMSVSASISQNKEIEDFSFSENIPDYTGNLVYVVNGNTPFFTSSEIEEAESSYESYSNLDVYGRCGAAISSVSVETMPTEERGDISSIHPSGWWGMKESTIGPERCHILGFQLTGENANEKNFVTGTHTLNVTGMLPYENMVADQVKTNGGHVLYRVTPDFRNYDELCRGVLMEAYSVEDSGKALSFCVYIYNVQDGWDIDYQTATAEYTGESTAVIDDTAYGDTTELTNAAYVLNTNSKKIHKDECSALAKTALRNKQSTNKSLKELEAEGYSKCAICFE